MATNNYNNKLEAWRGNSKDLTIIVYDSSDNLFDLTGYTGNFYMQKFPIRTSDPIDVSITQTSNDPSNGAILFNLTQNNLDISVGDYAFEVIIDDASVNKHTVIRDRFQIKKSLF